MIDLTPVDGLARSSTGARRTEVLAVLRAGDEPMSAPEVAQAAGLHPNTARVHLDALVKDGLAQRASEPRDRPGRPRILFSAQGPAPGLRSFSLLAEMLTGLVASLDEGPALAQETGRAWGRHLVEGAPPSRRIDSEEALGRLGALMDQLGFRPQDDSQPQAEVEMRLLNCPFREVAAEHTDIVCGLHRGLLEGAIEELRAPLQVADLEAFATPHSCVVRLRAARPR